MTDYADDSTTSTAEVGVDEGRPEDPSSLARMVLESTQDADRSRAQLSEWQARVASLDAERVRLVARLERERLNRLIATRRRIIAENRVQRLRARRWSRVGEALARWRRKPHRVDELLRAIKAGVTSQPLPEPTRLESLELQIQELRDREGAVAPSSSTLVRARELFEQGAYEDALRLLDELPDVDRRRQPVCLLARDCHVRMGNVSRALLEVRRALAGGPDEALDAQARLLEGRIREMGTTWLPQIALPPAARRSSHAGRVLHVVKESLPFFERGYTIRSHSTFLAQRRAGFEPVAVTSLGFPREQGFEQFPMSEKIDGIPHHRLDLGASYDMRRVPLDLQLDDHATMLARIADDLRPEIVQAGSGYRGYETALVGLAVSRRLDVPFIYEFRSHLEHTWTGEIARSEAGEQYEGRTRQELRCLTEADRVITIAEAMRSELVERGVPADRISVIPNVVDVDRFAPRQPDARLQEAYGLAGRQVVGYISNLGKREGIEHLVRAVSHLRDAGRDVVGLVAGDGPEYPALAALVDELDLGGSFVLAGHVPNERIEDHYALIDVFVVPRIDDKAARLVTPLKPLEAMAMEKPVVAADLPALREMVTAERGELFPPGDHEHLASLLGELLHDEHRRRTLGRAGRRWVAEERTIAANARRYRAVLDAATGG